MCCFASYPNVWSFRYVIHNISLPTRKPQTWKPYLLHNELDHPLCNTDSFTLSVLQIVTDTAIDWLTSATLRLDKERPTPSVLKSNLMPSGAKSICNYICSLMSSGTQRLLSCSCCTTFYLPTLVLHGEYLLLDYLPWGMISQISWSPLTMTIQILRKYCYRYSCHALQSEDDYLLSSNHPEPTTYTITIHDLHFKMISKCQRNCSINRGPLQMQQNRSCCC